MHFYLSRSLSHTRRQYPCTEISGSSGDFFSTNERACRFPLSTAPRRQRAFLNSQSLSCPVPVRLPHTHSCDCVLVNGPSCRGTYISLSFLNPSFCAPFLMYPIQDSFLSLVKAFINSTTRTAQAVSELELDNCKSSVLLSLPPKFFPPFIQSTTRSFD